MSASHINFPELPTPDRVRGTLQSFWSHSRQNVFAVYARRQLRWWSTSRADAEAWAHRYLYDKFQVRERKPRVLRRMPRKLRRLAKASQ